MKRFFKTLVLVSMVAALLLAMASCDVIEKVAKLENNTALLEGVVSRKKQVVPIMTENA